MQKIKLISSNKDRAILLTLIVVLFAFLTIIIPFVFVQYIPQSLIGNYVRINANFIFISIPILCYFLYTGVFIHKIKLDPYIISISSYRSLTSILIKKDYIDISHLMLKEYAFFNRPFSINRTLMIKIESDSKKIIAKRFTLSLLGNKEEKRISRVLDQILSNNN